MMDRRNPWKPLLVGLLAVKIVGTLFYFSGSGYLTGVVFHPQAANAQEKEAAPATPAPGARPTAALEKKTASSADVGAVLKRLDIERKRLELEEERIGKQREQLEALKREIEEKIEQLAKIQEQISSDLERKEATVSEKDQKLKAAEEAKIKMLSKVYASMKPKQAAAIIDKMDIDIIQRVFSQMKGEQVGSILSYVEQDRAAKISERLAEMGLPQAAAPAKPQ
jgi:flagellar motility protein MotE (MotC chaperone)